MAEEQNRPGLRLRPRTPAQRLGAVAAGSVLVVGAGGAAWAATASPSPSPTQGGSGTATASPSPGVPDQRDGDRPPGDRGPGGSDGPGRRAGGHGPGMGFGMGFGIGIGPGPALHGEYVVPKDGGGYQTVAGQTGEVTAVDGSSVTVRSEDGYTRKYEVPADALVNAARDGLGTIKQGHRVSVVATVSGETATAVRVVDFSVEQAARERWFPGRSGSGPDDRSGAATPRS
jgi:hypothetical protein